MGSSSDKKRKSAEDTTSQTKKKKTASEKSSKSPKFINVGAVKRPQYAPPVVAATSGLALSPSIQFQAYATPADKTSKRKKNGTPAQELLLHSASHRTMDYTAREDRTGDSSEPYLKHYIGIFNPKTSEVEIVEARKTVLRGTVRTQKAVDEAMEEKTQKQQMVAMRNELGEAFGTKKAKKAIRDVTENAITSQKVGQSELVMMDSIKTATKDMSTKEDLQAAVDNARPVPRANLAAEEIADVYVPAQIIGSEVLNAIPVMDWQESIKNLEDIQVPSRFVAKRVSNVASSDDAVHRLRVLRYLLFVIIFWNATSQGRERGTRSIGKRDKLRELMAPAPEIVIENIRRKFSDGGVMRKTHVDLLMTHCCAFAAIIDGFKVNTLDLREDLKLEQKQLNQYFIEIGARVKQQKVADKMENFAVLALPLQFPKIRLPARKR